MTEISAIPLSCITSLGNGHLHTQGDTVVLVTDSRRWAFSAQAKFTIPGVESRARAVKVRIEVQSGVLGIGWLRQDGTDWVSRASANPATVVNELSLVIPARTLGGSLVFDNWTEGGKPALGRIRSIEVAEIQTQQAPTVESIATGTGEHGHAPPAEKDRENSNAAIWHHKGVPAIDLSRSSSVVDLGKMLIFLHLPKTGGTSVRKMLGAALQPSTEVEGPDSIRRFLRLSEGERSAIRFASGHMPYGLHQLTNKLCSYVVFLRDPIDRILSAYYYIERAISHPFYPKLRDGMSLLQFSQEDLSSDNGQTRRLAKYSFIEALDKTNYWWTGIPIGSLTLDHLEQAKATLEACEFIGFCETLDRDSSVLLDRIGLPTRPKVPRFNQTLGRPTIGEIEPRVVNAIRQQNSFDLELYEYARSLAREKESLSAHRSL